MTGKKTTQRNRERRELQRILVRDRAVLPPPFFGTAHSKGATGTRFSRLAHFKSDGLGRPFLHEREGAAALRPTKEASWKTAGPKADPSPRFANGATGLGMTSEVLGGAEKEGGDR